MATTFNKLADLNKKWYIIDLEDIVLGRAASHVALILKGKNKADYTPFLDCGDNVIVVNAKKIRLKGKKLTDKIYYWHTGYPGGIKDISAKKLLEKNPEKLFQKAVKGMLARGPLGRKQLSNLYIYEGENHPHEGQKPEKIDFANLNKKNK
ncbi:MAG: 50S ribosomal protein L13 [Rickettsiales bacterium]|nr:50S ribosomal protein L13 [Rickettsiales bacterium]